MALRNCPECGKQISSQVTTCPHCGKAIGFNIGRFLLLLIFVFLILYLIGQASNMGR